MKKFVIGLASVKLICLSIFGFVVLDGCKRAALPTVETVQTKPIAVPTATTQTDDNINRPVSEPYRGDLSIFEDENRAKNLQIDRVMDILKIQTGKSVADIGAGSGWFTTRAAKQIGSGDKVFAVEINQEYIDYIKNRAKKENLANIETVLGTEDNPMLAANSIDAAMILKTYHEIGQPIKVLENLRKSLKKDGLLGIIDRNGRGDDHGIDKEKVIEEARRAGFSVVGDYDFVKPDGMDYFLVFKIQ